MPAPTSTPVWEQQSAVEVGASDQISRIVFGRLSDGVGYRLRSGTAG